MSLFQELKRRNVFKVGVAYLVIGWVVIQAADLLAPQLNLPEWAPRLVTFLVLIGFPLALVLAWIFDLTPEGVQVAEGRVGQKWFYSLVGIFTVVALGWFFAGGRQVPPPVELPGTASVAAADARSAAVAPTMRGEAPVPLAAAAAAATGAAPSVAVLPFVNMSPDPENEYFADGISEELLNILARVPGLKVASRTSAFSFKGSGAPIPAIAEALQVEHVLEGSVRKQGERVRITAQLIHAASDAHLWSDTFDRQLTDIFQVQEDIAQSITTSLEDVLGVRRVQVTAPTRDLEAYERFLRGRSRFFQRTDLDDALADFQFAVARDARFAEAWAFLAATAMVHSVSSYPTQMDRAEIGKLVAPAADRALALNANMPLVMAVKGYSLMEGAQRSEGLALMERAAAAELGDSTARMWLGMHRLSLGWIDPARAVLESAHESDSLVGINAGWLGVAHLLAGNEAEGERLGRRALELSGWDAAATMLSIEYANRGDTARSRAWREQKGAHWAEAWERALRDPQDVAAHLDMLQLGTDRRMAEVELALATANADALFAVLAPGASWLDRLWVSVAAWLPSTQWLREEPRFYALMARYGNVGLWEQFGFPLDCRPVDDPVGRRLECGGED